MNEKTERKPGSGGKREGTGRKVGINGIKGQYTLNLYPAQREHLISQFGSIQKAIDSIEWPVMLGPNKPNK